FVVDDEDDLALLMRDLADLADRRVDYVYKKEGALPLPLRVLPRVVARHRADLWAGNDEAKIGAIRDTLSAAIDGMPDIPSRGAEIHLREAASIMYVLTEKDLEKPLLQEAQAIVRSNSKWDLINRYLYLKANPRSSLRTFDRFKEDVRRDLALALLRLERNAIEGERLDPSGELEDDPLTLVTGEIEARANNQQYKDAEKGNGLSIESE